MWALPLLMISACMAVLCSWAVRGATDVGRVLWTLAFALAVLGYPAGYLVGMFAGPRSTRTHHSSPAPDPPPERIEPIGPR
jgi:hypothetical protein